MRKFLTFFLTALLAFGVGWAGNTFQKVTTKADVVVGKCYILVYNNLAMGPLSSGNGTEAPVTVNNNGTVDISNSDALVFTIRKNAYGYHTLELLTGGYLAVTGAKGNLTTKTTDEDGWNLATAGDGVGLTSYLSTNSRGILHRDGYTFRHYAISNATSTGYAWAQLYVEIEGGDTPQKEDVALSFSESTCEATMGQNFTAPTLTVDPIAATSEVVYSSSDEGVATVDNNGNVTLVAAGTTTITAAISDNETYIDASDSYTLTVTDPNIGILDFTEATHWDPDLPEGSANKIEGPMNYYDGNYLIRLVGTKDNGFYKAYSSNYGNYFILGKEGAYLQFPAFNKPVKKFVIEGSGGASQNVVQNIYVGNTAVSTETTGAQGTNTYLINPNYQAAGNIYTLKVSSNHNTQFKKIYIYFDENASEVPIITVEPSSVTITDATGENKSGAISATVNPAGTVNASASDGWSATSSSVTYQGLALHAEGTATFSSQGATDVTADLEYNYTGPLYILGTVNNGGWAPNNYVTMTRDEATGLYTARVTTAAGEEGMSWISFTKRVANDNDDGAWNYIAPYRFVPYSEDVNTAWWLTDDNVNQFNTLDFDLSHVYYQPVRMVPGTYDITINANDNTFKIQPYIVTVETPTFDPEAGSYKAFQSVTINCATEDATIHYTIDGSEPTADSPVYLDPIVVESTTTIKAIAMKDGMANSTVAEATYTLPQSVADIAAAYALTGNLNFLFTGNAVVTYVGQSTINSDYRYIFIRDKDAESGGGVIFYNNKALPNVQAKDVLKRGWFAQLRPYHNWKEFQYAENVEASGTQANADPFDRTGMQLMMDANVNEYIKIDNVTYNNGAISYAGQNREEVTYTYTVVNHFNVELVDGKTYDLTGVVTRDNSNIIVYPTAAELVQQKLGLAFEPASDEIYVGQEVTPELKNLPADLSVTYSSDNAEVATVDENGKVTAVAAGTTTIKAIFAGNDVYEADTASFTITVLAKKAAGLTYGEEAVVFNVKVGDNIEEPALDNPNRLTVTYESSDTTVAKVDNLGNVSIVGAGTAVITAKSEATTEYLAGEASYTINVTKKDLEASLEGDTELEFTLGDEFTVPTLKGVPEDLNVTYESNDTTVATVDAEGNVTIVGPGEATITITVEGNDMYNGTTLTYTIKVNDVVENIQTLTFYPASGTYTEAKNVAIACATPGVNIEYKIGDGEWQTYNAPFTVAQSCTVTAKATKGTRTVWVDSEATATYTINAKAPVQIANGYYNLKSNGINQYANIQGRRTLTFTNDIDKQAGTVLQVETDANGQVKTLRSQGVDIQGYAKRAMAYVPTIVQMVVDKLNAEGEGNLLGENGLDSIKAKFDECFDYHLYVEGSEGAYRIYGRTPSMQPVVDFYAENKDKVDAKLPQLEEFIQSAIVKLRNKANGAGYDGTTVFEDFTLRKIWQRMGSNLIEPVDDASKMAFYQQVLTNKQYVWDFAYQTAMLYINNVKESETYKNLAAENEDLDLLVNKMTSIRPETKYFIIENGNELDYVSENHTYIINDNAQTYWSLSPREDFTVTFPEENKVNDSYYTTLYTDFAYNVPEDVTAYAVTGIDGNNLADLTAFTGTIPAQTPVLLMTKDNGAKAVTKALELTTETGTVPEGNLLVGPDYLINEYKLTSPTVEGLFNMAQAILKQDLYNEYVKPYEYLMLKTAGTVNNKYFWGLTQADVEKCVAGEDNDCVIRNLVGDEFVNNWTAPKNNEAFLVSADKDVIYLSLEPAEAPTFSPVPGSYTSNDPIDVTITGPAGATIEYSTDGGNIWKTYNDTPISVNGEVTILARTKATQSGTSESETVKGYYIIDKPDELPTMDPFDGYYSVKNNGNEKYVNVAGRKTITFAREADIDKMAGTVIYLKTDEHGQVQSLRSQAADLQGYADKAMRYVPEIVQMAVDKLHAEGEGNLLGETGLDSIMAKFNKCFDHHLYVEPADGGYRLYGKTPSMQPVVDFYRENQAKVEAKLPQLEAFINSAIQKVLEKTGGRGASILKPFSLLQTWQRMDSALVDADLIKPVDEATTMDFYRQVLNNKKYVWAFAYETAMTYWERLKANQTFQNNIDKLGEFAQYIDKIEDVHPDFKYYIVQDNDKPDYISEGNIDIKNNVARTIWTLDPRTTFSVNFADDMTMDERLYYTTLYTDFAYSMPEGVKAYKVTEVNQNGVGAIEALEGTIPAQTPVLLKANAAGDVELTIAAAGDADVTGNLLVGADYFINEYQINTPQVEGLFEMVASIFGENSTFYQELLTKYGHLMLKTSGTVNNKYFWALTNDDLNQCVAGEDNDCVVRKLNKGEDGIGFYRKWSAPANQAFLSNSEFNPVKLLLGKDVTRDGLWNVADVTATISIILETAPEGNNYDLDAADFDNNGRINVADVTAMIAYILGKVN